MMNNNMNSQKAARVAATPLIQHFGKLTNSSRRMGGSSAAECLGLPVADGKTQQEQYASRLGALITVTTDNLNAVECLQSLFRSDTQLRLDRVFVMVDFKNKSGSMEAVAMRRQWARKNVVSLQRMADRLNAMAQAPVLVELIDMNSCMGKYLSINAFNGYNSTNCGSLEATCETSGLWKNTVAFAWGLARMTQCVRYAVHVDNDILLRRSPGGVAWVSRALAVLKSNDSLLSVHPTRGTGPACNRRPGADRCDCTHNRAQQKLDPRWPGPATRMSGGLYFTRVERQKVGNSMACLLTYVGPHKPDVPHFSIQAFVLDLLRFQELLPLKPYHYVRYGPYNASASEVEALRATHLETFERKHGIFRLKGKVDPESIFEENARRAGLKIVYLAPSDLGVEKVVNPKRHQLQAVSIMNGHGGTATG